MAVQGAEKKHLIGTEKTEVSAAGNGRTGGEKMKNEITLTINDIERILQRFGAKKAEAKRWAREKIKPAKIVQKWNGYKYVNVRMYSTNIYKKINENLIEKWREEEQEKRRKNAERNRQKQKKINEKLDKIRTAKTIVFDTETTGLNPFSDEILELAIIDENGKKLFYERFKPQRKKEWREAQNVNHISPSDVARKYPFRIYKKIIQKIFDGAEKMVGYNLEFDTDFLAAAGIKFNGKIGVDVMLDFAPIYGEWHDYFGDYKWQRLGTCARYYNYDWGSTTAHGALADSLATLHCYKKMNLEA